MIAKILIAECPIAQILIAERAIAKILIAKRAIAKMLIAKILIAKILIAEMTNCQNTDCQNTGDSSIESPKQLKKTQQSKFEKLHPQSVKTGLNKKGLFHSNQF